MFYIIRFVIWENKPIINWLNWKIGADKLKMAGWIPTDFKKLLEVLSDLNELYGVFF